MKVVATLVAIVAILAAAGLGFMWNKANGELKDTQAKLAKTQAECTEAKKAQEAAQAELSDVQSKLGELQTAKATAEKKLAALQGKYDELTANLGTAEGAGEDALNSLQKTISELRSQIETKASEITALTGKVDSLNGEVEAKTAEVAKLGKEVEAAVAAKAAAEKKADGFKITLLENGLPVEAPAVFEGEVLAVNPAGADFPASYVLSIGVDNGLPVGQELKVVRGAEYIGTINVVRIYEDNKAISGAESKNLVSGQEVKVGDKVSSQVGVSSK